MGNESMDALLVNSPDSHNEPEQLFRRTGTLWTAIAHIITGVIGAGVLSLAWSVAQLGWVAGPLTMVAFAGITVVSTFILCDCYMSPDPEYGPVRQRSLLEAVNFYLGEKSQRICGIFLLEGFYGAGVTYTITAASSVRAIQKSNCYHKEGHRAICGQNDYIFTILFGLIQVVLSQIPNFHDMAWLSVLAAIMSFSYASIGLGLGFAKVIENGEIMGTITGVPGSSPTDKIWSVFEALGDVAFAYPFSMILLEIQDTLKSPPPEVHTMRKATTISLVTTTFFYLCCGCSGYAAFGSNTPGDLLTGFGFYEPYWVVDFANACVFVHLVGGYQIYSQPIFSSTDKWVGERFRDSVYIKNFIVKLPLLPAFELNIFRLCFRTVYVVSTTFLALLFPYFNQVLGVLGALNFWPVVIYFPLEMYMVQRNIGVWTRKWILLHVFSIICLMISILGLVGSMQKLISARFS